MDVSNPKRIVLLGKTGSGKSSVANTIFGEEVFKVNHSFNAETQGCRAITKSVNGRSISLIDTPGLFDTERSEEEMKPEILRCITECAPGPHAFLIVLKAEKFTEQEQAVINKIYEYFSEEALKYAVIVFTHGDQIAGGKKIKELVSQNKNLSDLVKKCGDRCHVIDNKYWNNNQQDEYRSNRFQVEELLKTIDKMVIDNKGNCYTNEMLQAVEKELRQEEDHIRQSSGNMSEEEIGEKAKKKIWQELVIRLAGVGTGALIGALLGAAVCVVGVVSQLHVKSPMELKLKGAAAVGASVGAVSGGVLGYDAAEGADTPLEAAKRTVDTVFDKAKQLYKMKSQQMSNNS